MNYYYLIYRDIKNIIDSYYIISNDHYYNGITGTIVKINDSHNNSKGHCKVGIKDTFNSKYATLVTDAHIINELDKLVTFQ